MSSLRNALPRRVHKERAQPRHREKFGILEKHKDYVIRARQYQKKAETIRKLKEKAAFRNPDEFYFKMIKSKTVDGVHIPANQANTFSQEELLLMKTQDIGYVLQKAQSEKKKVDRLSSVLHSVNNPSSSNHVYFADDRDEAKELQGRLLQKSDQGVSVSWPKRIKKKTAASYKELAARKKRAYDLEKMYMEMAYQKELKKKGQKRRVKDHELVSPTDRPVYKWERERKR
ncbi:probable U3 small nucleolar RNA-associated protein 11 [Amborella trichopoda]|nr:probable U3 small nucleolar RNA-associated protein 11 [Amborella trichopoda]XP_020517977.1 probable U3 small nucleolar RNA-associated protein 11 [Amborella trichopoda]|eukprot:XP_006832868.2 probable U3 small nucleolar RNA-associated protein 11 [Amborella trichopoda]